MSGDYIDFISSYCDRCYTRRSVEWLQDAGESLRQTGDSALREALAIVGWDVWLIGAKIHRALKGRDVAQTGEWLADHAVQNDGRT